MSGEKLLPCPFCGQEPVTEPWHGGLPTKLAINCPGIWPDDTIKPCEVAPMVTGETTAEAIAAWNTRPDAPASTADAEKDFSALNAAIELLRSNGFRVVDASTSTNAAMQAITASCEYEELGERLSAEIASLREAAGRMAEALGKLGLRKLVAGWNGEDRPEGPYEPHPRKLGITLKTNAGQLYDLDAALSAWETDNGQ